MVTKSFYLFSHKDCVTVINLTKEMFMRSNTHSSASLLGSKTTLKTVLAGAALLFVLCDQSVNAEPVSALMEKAIYAQETAGDLDGAITMYQQIIDSPAIDPAIRQQAQRQLDLCNAKKGIRVACCSLEMKRE